MSSLHQPVLPAEVFRRICQCLMVDIRRALEFDSEAANAILSLTRTCKQSLEPALDTIWHTIPTVACLLYAMPQDLWIAEDVYESANAVGVSHTRLVRSIFVSYPECAHCCRQSFVRSPRESDFARIEYYTRRVRQVIMDFQYTHLSRVARFHIVAPGVLHAFVARYPDGKLFPYLQVLRMACMAEDPTALPPYTPVFFTPSLNDVFYCPYTMQVSDMQDFGCCGMLEKLQRRSPSLRRLGLIVYPDKRCNALSLAVSRVICGFHALESLTNENIPLSLDAIRHLATLPSLQDLFTKLVATPGASHLELFRGSKHAIYFPALKKLKLIHERGLSVCTTTVGSVRSTVFESVEICCVESIPLKHIAEFFKVLAGLPETKSSLQCVSISINKLRDDPARFPITRKTLKPLLKLSNLRDVNIHIHHPMHIDDGLLCDMAYAWPNLFRLELRVRWPLEDSAPPATLAGLIPFVNACPSLSELGVAIRTDLSYVPQSLHELRPRCRALEHGLEILDVGRSEIQDPLAVAAFLFDLFPKLGAVVCDWPLEEDGWADGEDEEEVRRLLAESRIRDKWDHVSWLVSHFSKVRRQERSWAAEHGRRVVPLDRNES